MVKSHKSQTHPAAGEAVDEIKRISDIGLPMAAMSMIGYLKNMIAVICMGRLGNLELAGGALAIGFTNITGYSVLSGLATGMEPICSQGFGSCNTYIVDLTVQRTISMLLVASMPIGVLWFSFEHIMIWLHQNPDITHVANLYCRFAIPDLIANSFLHPLRIYLRSKGATWPLMWCSFLAVLLDIPITIFLSFKLHLSVQGVAIANTVTTFSNLLFLAIYLFYTHKLENPLCTPLLSHHQPSSTSSARVEWGTLLRLALPSCLAVCLEWWWYEFMTLLAGYLHKPEVTLATAAIVIQTTSLMYTLPTALSASVSTRVGNELGAGCPGKARITTMVSMSLALLSSFFGLLWTTLGREAWGSLFADDKEVLELTKAILPIIGLCELANCPQTTGCGVLRGSARPGIAAGINFCAFYLVGTPVAIVLAFVSQLGFPGLCYGLLAAQTACVISILTVIYKTDWEKESLKALDLVGCEHADTNQALKHDEEVGFHEQVDAQK